MKIPVWVFIVFSCLMMWIGFCYGNGKGYKEGIDDTLFSEKFILSQYQEHIAQHGSLHDTPWKEFTIQEKMYLCAYGSSGNKLTKNDMTEVQKLYGAR